jgi:hypothetical protein
MIAQIRLKDTTLIPRAEAEDLGLVSSPVDDRTGRRVADGFYTRLADCYKFRDEVVETESGSFYREESCSNKLSSWDVYDRVPEHMKDWVQPAEEQLVDILSFAPKYTRPYVIVRCVQPTQVGIEGVTSLLFKLEQKIKTLSTLLEAKESFNEACNVHIGGNTITQYNEVKVAEDYCTDALQTSLNQGWRIIAVCVQRDQRRPDYILGRWNPDLKIES